MSETEGPDIMPQIREPLFFRPLTHRRWYQFIEIICLNLVVVDVYFFILKSKMLELKHGSQNHDTDFTIGKNFKAQTQPNQGEIIQSLWKTTSAMPNGPPL